MTRDKVKGAGTAGAVVALVAAWAVAGCGSTSQLQTSSRSSTTVSSSATVSPSATSSSSTTVAQTSSSTSAALTAPGTALKVGQPATVEYDTTLSNGNSGPSYKLRLTIQSIKLGSMSDFKGISLSGVQKGDVPTYVRLEMTNLSGRSMNTSSNDPADSVQAIDPNGDADGDLILVGNFPPCPLNDTPSPFAAGRSFTTCETFMEPSEATKIGWTGSQATSSSPVVWNAH